MAFAVDTQINNYCLMCFQKGIFVISGSYTWLKLLNMYYLLFKSLIFVFLDDYLYKLCWEKLVRILNEFVIQFLID